MSVNIPYGVQTYKRADLPRIRLLNTYVEQVQNQSADIVLLPRPALLESYTVGTGPINGIFQQQGTLGSVPIVASRHLSAATADVTMMPTVHSYASAWTLNGPM